MEGDTNIGGMFFLHGFDWTEESSKVASNGGIWRRHLHGQRRVPPCAHRRNELGSGGSVRNGGGSDELQAGEVRVNSR